MTHRIRSPWWLVSGFVVALAAVYWWWSPSSGAPASASTPTPVVAQAPLQAAARKPAPAVAQPVEARPSASPFKLIGTVKAANGADSFALVRRAADSQVVKLRAGDRIEGLTVSAIQSDRVVLEGVAHAIVIEADNTVPSAPASPAPARAFSPTPAPEAEPEPAYAGDPAPFGH